MCRYDLKCIHAAVVRFLSFTKLEVSNIVRWLEVATANREKAFVDRCMQFLGGRTILQSVLECVLTLLHPECTHSSMVQSYQTCDCSKAWGTSANSCSSTPCLAHG
jgi:hypothetical protein